MLKPIPLKNYYFIFYLIINLSWTNELYIKNIIQIAFIIDKNKKQKFLIILWILKNKLYYATNKSQKVYSKNTWLKKYVEIDALKITLWH